MSIKVINSYIARQFLASLFLVIIIIASVVVLVDSIELIRRSYGKGLLIFKIITLVLLRLPSILQEILPFICFISGMVCYARLSRNSELVVLRASGVSAWQFMAPSIMTTLVIGITYVLVFTPITANMFIKSEFIEDKIIRGSSTTASAFSSGIWLKDQIPDLGNIIIHSSYISGSSSELNNVTFYIYGDNFNFIKRIDSEKAILDGGTWQLVNAEVSSKNSIAKKVGNLNIKTNINIEKLQDSFAKPANLSFWQLPEFINNMKKAGFSASRHIQYYYHLFIFPFLIASMTLMSGAFSIKVNQRSQSHVEILVGIFTSFVVYFMSQVIYTMGLSGSLPIILSVIAPTLLCLCIGAFIILQREDG